MDLLVGDRAVASMFDASAVRIIADTPFLADVAP